MIAPTRHPVVMSQELEILAMKDHVVAIIKINNSSIGLRFVSPEHLLLFFNQLMEQAIKVWPDNEWILEYQN